MPDTRRRLALFLLWTTPLLWSCNYLIARASVGVIAPHQLALWRWLLAFALMLPFAWAPLTRKPRLWLREWRQLAVLGGLGMWVCGAFVYQGGQTTAALNIGLIYAACPVGIALLSAKLLHERIAPAQAAGGALALLGVVFVILKGDASNLLAFRLTPGDAWIVVAAAAWVVYSVLPLRWHSVLAPSARVAAAALAGVIVMLPLTLAEALLVDTPAFSGRALLLVVLAAVLPGALSYSAYALVQHELGAARSGLMLYLAPLYAAALAWGLLGEPPRLYHAIGAAFILPSIALSTRAAPRRREP